jgi:hypothetical protein
MYFERIGLDEVDWPLLDAAGDRLVSQTRGWLAFLERSQRGELVVARLHADGVTAGYLTGMIVRRLGVRQFGSPLIGWSTPFLGFNLLCDVPPSDALAAAGRFALRDLRCVHMELRDWRLTVSDGAADGFLHRLRRSFLTDLAPDEDTLFSRMSSACRRCVRSSVKQGVVVENAAPEGFADDYYAQLLDVFAKQGMRPTYGVERVQALVDALHPTGALLLLRARDPEGHSIATGLYPGFGDWSFFWGNASLRPSQRFRPNEALNWTAMRTWKARGVRWFDWGGGGDYKLKYGGAEIWNPHFYKSRHRLLTAGYERAFALYYGTRALVARTGLLR